MYQKKKKNNHAERSEQNTDLTENSMSFETVTLRGQKQCFLCFF